MEENSKSYFELKDLDVYKLSRERSRLVWEKYESMSWQLKKVLGDQWMESTDSIGANIAEGYGRYHYLDKTKFYFNARGSLLESQHWSELAFERQLIDEVLFQRLTALADDVLPKLNALIKSQFNRKNNP